MADSLTLSLAQVSDWKDQTEAGISMSIGKDFVA
jgi:hypothetical protein